MALLTAGVFGIAALLRYREGIQRGYVAVLRTQLTAVRTAQESYWSKYHRYAPTLDSLGSRWAQDVTIEIAGVDLTRGYIARATHRRHDRERCALYVGTDVPAVTSGDIVCARPDDLPRP